jgi:hypothetical protein
MGEEEKTPKKIHLNIAKTQKIIPTLLKYLLIIIKIGTPFEATR